MPVYQYTAPEKLFSLYLLLHKTHHYRSQNLYNPSIFLQALFLTNRAKTLVFQYATRSLSQSDAEIPKFPCNLLATEVALLLRCRTPNDYGHRRSNQGQFLMYIRALRATLNQEDQSFNSVSLSTSQLMSFVIPAWLKQSRDETRIREENSG